MHSGEVTDEMRASLQAAWDKITQSGGSSIRERAAIAAMQGLLAHPGRVIFNDYDPDRERARAALVDEAVLHADRPVEALEGKHGPETH